LGLLTLLLTACGDDGGGGAPSSPIKAWGAPTLIETDNTGDAFGGQVAFDAAGNALVVWTQFDGTRHNIWANRYSASTGLWGVAGPIETDTLEASGPQVAFDATGNALVVWTQIDSTPYNIWANRYSASTGLWGVAAPIETNAGFDFVPRVAIDATGNALAVWTQFDGTNYSIWANRYSASTGLWGVATRIENLAGDAEAPQIAIDTTGNALVVWRQFNNTRGSIWANRYSANTGFWGTATRIETNAGEAADADVAIDAMGNALVVWHQSDGPVSSTLLSMWANRLRCREVGWVGRTPPCELGN
jgi:hypothetical protein